MKAQNDWRHNNMYCVVVGDIINSKQIDPDALDDINTSIKETMDYINTTYMNSILADFGVVRGDAFEGILLTHYKLPQIINEIIKGFYKIQQTKVRICVVLGELSSISTDRNEANGPAFYHATECLTKMKAEKSEHWFQVTINTTSYAQPLLNGILGLISSTTEGWTDRQRDIIWAVEELSNQQHLVSKKLDISTSVVNKQLKAASYNAYRKAWLSIEEFFINLEENDIKEENNFSAYYGLAQRKNERNEYQDAYKMLLKALEITKKESTKNNPQLVLIYNELAENLIQLEDYENAEFYLNLSLQAQQDLPKSRLIYAKTLNIFGDLYLKENALPKAKESYDNALEIAINTVGTNHYFTNSCYNNVALVLRCEENYREAIEYYMKVLKYLSNHSQYNPIQLADVNYKLALCYLESGDTKNAIINANAAVMIYKSNLPSKHKDIKSANSLIEKILSKEDKNHGS